MSKKSAKIEHINVYGAIVSNFIIAVSKFIVASLTGSSAMLSEGIHSVADTGNQFLMLLGIRESKKPPNDKAETIPKTEIDFRDNLFIL